MVSTVSVALSLKACSMRVAVAVPLVRCGGSGLRDLPTCVTASCVADLSRIGSDLGADFLETSLERVGSGRPNLNLLTEVLL